MVYSQNYHMHDNPIIDASSGYDNLKWNKKNHHIKWLLHAHLAGVGMEDYHSMSPWQVTCSSVKYMKPQKLSNASGITDGILIVG